jgi:hypothetical protein
MSRPTMIAGVNAIAARRRDQEQVGEIFADGTGRIVLEDPDLHRDYPKRVKRLEITWTKIGETLQFSMREIEEHMQVQVFESNLRQVE